MSIIVPSDIIFPLFGYSLTRLFLTEMILKFIFISPEPVIPVLENSGGRSSFFAGRKEAGKGFGGFPDDHGI